MADLAGLIAKQGSDLRLRQAIVTAAPSGGTCTIRFGDLASTTAADDIAGVHYLAGVGINNGDTVQVLQTGGALLIIGRVAGTVDAWIPYTPTITQPGALSKTVNYSSYVKVGRLVIWSFGITLTSGGTAGNRLLLTYPVQPAGSTVAIQPGAGTIFHSGPTEYIGVWENFFSGSAFLAFRSQVGDLWGVLPNVVAVVGDVLTGTVTYEAAS